MIGVTKMRIFVEYLGIAFISAAALIIISKIIMSAFLRKDINYYEGPEAEEEQALLDKMRECATAGKDKNGRDDNE